jgi:preprotein translocase subunit YajC
MAQASRRRYTNRYICSSFVVAVPFVVSMYFLWNMASRQAMSAQKSGRVRLEELKKKHK